MDIETVLGIMAGLSLGLFLAKKIISSKSKDKIHTAKRIKKTDRCQAPKEKVNNPATVPST